MPDPNVNTENLRDLATHLATVHSTLNDADGDALDLAGMTTRAVLDWSVSR